MSKVEFYEWFHTVDGITSNALYPVNHEKYLDEFTVQNNEARRFRF